jgi:hypothetical protein
MSIRLSITVRIYADDAMERKDGDEDQCLSPNFISMGCRDAAHRPFTSGIHLREVDRCNTIGSCIHKKKSFGDKPTIPYEISSELYEIESHLLKPKQYVFGGGSLENIFFGALI